MKPKVKSCPFCGGTLMELKSIELWKPRETKFIMRCCACRAQTGIKETKEEAIFCWNLRHNGIYKGDEDE